MRVLVVGHDLLALRAATALAGHPDVALVGLADAKPPAGWKGRMVPATSSAGFDVVVGGTHPPLRSVTADDTGTITHAAPLGVARALATRLGGAPLVGMTVGGAPRRSHRHFDFPSPVGRQLGVMTDGVMICPQESQLAAVGAVLDGHTLAIIDNSHFLGAVALAAGVFIRRGSGPVWEHADRYLAACEQLGLVIAEA